MKSNTDNIKDHLGFYKLLEVNTTATTNEIKKAYYKLALKWHPDKLQNKNQLNENSNKEIKEVEDNIEFKESISKFQKIQMAYEILSDPEKRKLYNAGLETSMEQLFEERSYETWLEVFQNLFEGLVNEASIEELKKEYVNSEEQKRDVLATYEKVEGDFDLLMESIMFAETIDEPRFMKWIEEGIKNNQLEEYEKYKTTTSDKAKKRRRLAELKEAKLAKIEKEKMEQGDSVLKSVKQKALTNGGLDSLALAIRQKQKDRQESSDAFFDALEKKYASKEANKKKRGKKEAKIPSSKKKKV